MQTFIKKIELFLKDRAGWQISFLIFLLVIMCMISIAVGRFNISPFEIIRILASKFLPIEKTWDPTLETVIFNVRLPRIIAAILVGASLSTAGAAYQGMFKNPLVSPDILGASAGAGFGAALAIFCSLNVFAIQALSFCMGILAVSFTYMVSCKVRHDPLLALVLSGILTSSLFAAATSLLKYVADPYDKLPAITFWLMGSLASMTVHDIKIAVIPIFLGSIVLYLVRWKINVLALGEEEARALGLNTNRLKILVIFCATLITAASVSISGTIGWVGLLVPHIARMLVGPNYKILLPTSFLIGSIYLLLVDDIARNIAAIEVPLGILTALIGAPFFIYLFSRRKE
ncbi:MAG: iron ABC transporter permease [Clostridia bacterium]|jgi:iron complex transport system permease protein|nr:iron ABC transporter permease [Clostridia bacterium]MDD4571201.1 iron ABC transporter permease [Clostridia bacterium]